MAKENTMSKTLDKLLEKVNEELSEDGPESTTPKSYSELEASINTKDTQFAKLEKKFPISKSVLKHNLPALFKIIDTISIKNIIYSDTSSVNTLLTDVLFSELKKIDNKVNSFYTNIKPEEDTSSKCKEEAEDVKEPKEATNSKYESLSIEYNHANNKYTVHYPDFLDEAFDTIINKKEVYDNMVTISRKKNNEATPEATATATAEATATATPEATATATATATAATIVAATVASTTS
jgi:hypothetical protein